MSVQSDHRSTKPGVPSSNLGGRATLGNDNGTADFWPLKPAEIARFALNIDASGGPDACHPWQAGANWNGYGLLKIRGTCTTAHRVALALKLGRWPGRHEVTRHSEKCTTRLCCNQLHLSVGTHKDNSRDCMEAGRSRKGQPQVTITEEQARAVRRLYAEGGRAPDVAVLVGVSVASVFAVVSCRTWAHLGPPLKRRAVVEAAFRARRAVAA